MITETMFDAWMAAMMLTLIAIIGWSMLVDIPEPELHGNYQVVLG